MKIKCFSNKKAPLQTNVSSENESYKQDSIYEFLHIGKEYTVYGMLIKHGQVWYYICDRAHTLFPIARPAYLFEIIDNRLSRYWVFGIIEGFEKQAVWTFSEWINEAYFQDNLTDDEEREKTVFKSYKELMDLEFPDSSISETAQSGDKEWLICPMCLDAWQYKSERDALVRCPKCLKVLNNPRYKNEYPHL